jgi:hypothetical protein
MLARQIDTDWTMIGEDIFVNGVVGREEQLGKTILNLQIGCQAVEHNMVDVLWKTAVPTLRSSSLCHST